MSGVLAALLRDERGAIEVEYAIMAAVIGAATALSLGALGDALDGMYKPILHAKSGAQSHALPDAVTR